MTGEPPDDQRNCRLDSSETLLLDLAWKHFRIDTLETRNIDSLDFHEVSFWSIRAALEEAHAAGRRSVAANIDTNR